MIVSIIQGLGITIGVVCFIFLMAILFSPRPHKAREHQWEKTRRRKEQIYRQRERDERRRKMQNEQIEFTRRMALAKQGRRYLP